MNSTPFLLWLCSASAKAAPLQFAPSPLPPDPALFARILAPPQEGSRWRIAVLSNRLPVLCHDPFHPQLEGEDLESGPLSEAGKVEVGSSVGPIPSQLSCGSL